MTFSTKISLTKSLFCKILSMYILFTVFARLNRFRRKFVNGSTTEDLKPKRLKVQKVSELKHLKPKDLNAKTSKNQISKIIIFNLLCNVSLQNQHI